MEQQEIERRNLAEYKIKLIIGDTTLPDPLSMKKNKWIGENEGILTWPSVYIMDISKFFKNVVDSSDLIHRLKCEYKEGKAYRYFTDEFVKEIFINPISDFSKYCMMKTRCVPSQRVSSRPYDVWAIIQKDTEECPGGEVVSAYCSCPAGLLGSCNHVAGMLFRIEATVITGVTKPTCTSRLSEWVIPSKNCDLEPGRISSMLIKKDHYKKKAIVPSKSALIETANKKRKFSPMSASQEHYLQKPDKVRSDFYEKIKNIVPRSTFAEFMEKKRLS